MKQTVKMICKGIVSLLIMLVTLPFAIMQLVFSLGAYGCKCITDKASDFVTEYFVVDAWCHMQERKRD